MTFWMTGPSAMDYVRPVPVSSCSLAWERLRSAYPLLNQPPPFCGCKHEPDHPYPGQNPSSYLLPAPPPPLSFALISSLVVALMHGSGDMLYALDLFGRVLGIREDGAALALLLIARTFGGMCSLFFIALTTPMIEIFALLSSLRIPKSVIELSMMIYRYIFVLLDQAAMIHNAQVMRLGNRSIRSSLASFSMLASVLFLRSWEQGERLVIAMDARCYDGRLDLMEERRGARAKEIVAAAAYLAMALAISIASSRQGII